MTLDELVRRHARPAAGNAEGVPPWTLGCFRRRAITFATGETDTETLVMWLQTRGLTADLRLPPRPSDPRGDVVRDIEGGLARTRWDGRAMHWSAWTSFQTHDRWPEPGLLFRIGDCLIERAPSGAYVEDWRLQPSEDGPLVGLRLIEERALAGGEVRHRGGGLVVCGRHAALVLGRPAPLPVAGTVADVVAAHGEDPAVMRALFACEASYGIAASGAFTVAASTNPRREGQTLFDREGFSYEQDLVVQRTQAHDGTPVERRFTVDTLEADVSFPLDTQTTSDARQWLAREAPTLLARARRP